MNLTLGAERLAYSAFEITFVFFFMPMDKYSRLPKFESKLSFLCGCFLPFICLLVRVWSGCCFKNMTSLYPEWPQTLDLPDSATGIMGCSVSQAPFNTLCSTGVAAKRTRSLPRVYLPMPGANVPWWYLKDINY